MSPSAEAGWLPTDDGALFCWWHRPQSGSARAGVVCCPPLLSEYDAAFLTFRDLGDALAEAGLAALRFDWPGTGNSTGDQTRFTSVQPWLDAVAAGVSAMRRSGVDTVIVLGMRAGANLVAAASKSCSADAVVLWDPAASGRAFVRHSTLLQRTVVELKASQGDAPGGPLPASPLTSVGDTDAVGNAGSASLGYAYRDEFVDSLRHLRLDMLADVPTLLLTRTAQVPQQLRGRTSVEVLRAVGQEALLETYLDLAETPQEALADIVEWIGQRVPVERFPLVSPIDPHVHPAEGVVERTARFGPTRLFGIVTEPARSGLSAPGSGPSDRPTCLILNSGLVPNPGPHRFSTDLARKLAEEGIRVVRVDLSGIGDSPTRPGRPQRVVYSPVAMDDVRELLDALGSTNLFVTGVCSGGYHALEAAAIGDLVGVLAVHAWLDIWNVNNRPDSAGGDRRIWVADRPWLRKVNSTRIGASLLWRLPALGWRLLDRLGLQADLSRGLQAVLERRIPVTMIVEDDMMRRPRSDGLRRIRSPYLTLVPSRADHSLFDEVGRDELVEVARGTILAAFGARRSEAQPA